jgi:hypothetical protein
MTTFLFVHGTGVRKAAFDETLSALRSQVESRDPTLQIRGCFWGGEHGVKLPEFPRSIPRYNQTKAIGGASPEDQTIVLWEVLYQDALFELRLLAQTAGQLKPLAPNQASPAQVLAKKVDGLRKSTPVLEAIALFGLERFWNEAWMKVCKETVFRDAMSSPLAGTGAHRLAIARALVAAMTAAAIDEQLPVPGATERDKLIEVMLEQLGGRDKAALDIVTRPLLGLASRFGTRKIRRNRGKYTDDSFEVIGDILLYQVRGDDIRAYIQTRIEEVSKEIGATVVVIAHSLGGIACVDLFAGPNPPKIRALITAGSQAPFFYEINALSARTFGKPLPDAFPQWLNFYDLNDPLSYVGAGVFPGKVRDKRIASGQPFPASHSAYWRSREMWDHVLAFVDGLPT